jgi:hypothetical protein
MNRWAIMIQPLLEYLESGIGIGGLRERIDVKIRELEEQAENAAEPLGPFEKPSDRAREFREALRIALMDRLRKDPGNGPFQEALVQLNQPSLRHPDRRPKA